MATFVSEYIVEAVREAAHVISGAKTDYEALFRAIGDSRYVLLGEATHGTLEFYQARFEITRRLVEERGFNIIAWEADWPDTLKANRFVQLRGNDQTAQDALSGFERFPVWMWRNVVILDLLNWLRQHNEKLPHGAVQAGVYGIDLYSLHRSIQSVLSYLAKTDPEAAKRARDRYSCFEDFGQDPQCYGMIAGMDQGLSCEEDVVSQLVELQKSAAEFLSRDGRHAADEWFYAEQNARVAKNAEHYYRALYRGRPNTWNIRDKHMVESLDLLMDHLRSQDENPKAVIWAHNSHLGDARATQMSERGELNVGQLIRERHGREAFNVGFTTYSGTVMAASEWDGPAHRKRIVPGLEGSYEALFHDVGIPRFFLNLRARNDAIRELRSPMLERAIGVIYHPATERWSHYFDARLAEQFDAVIHFDETRALRPIDRHESWHADNEPPETYPFGV